MKQRFTIWLPVISIILCIFLIACYRIRPDSCAAVTFFPVWVWSFIGFLLITPGLRANRRLFIAAAGLWIIFTLGFSEEPHSLVRKPAMSPAEFESARKSGRAVRVVTLNCASGNSRAAFEVKAYDPDIVLLQESPGKSQIEKLAKELFGKNAGYVCGVDASIIARGKLKARKLPTELALCSTRARVTLVSGMELDVISLRLVPPVFRLDLWSPSCWRDQSENRRQRCLQLKNLMEDVRATDVPVVIGGDFNAPAGDAIYKLLCPAFHDTFRKSGIGWGHTVLNDTPVQRVDQIWATDNLRAVDVRAHKTKNSDHRLVAGVLVMNR